MATLLDPTSNEQKHPKLTSAVIVGATTPTSSRLWVRVYQEGHWTLVVTPAPLTGDLVRLDEKPVAKFLAQQRIQPVFIGSADITQASNLTAVFDVAPLQPDTRYYYAVIADTTDASVVRRRTEMGGDSPLSFCTPPAAPREVVFGFYSCHDPISASGDCGAWPHLHEQLTDAGAHFVIGGGDQIYVDTNGKNGFLDIWSWLKDNKAALLEKFALGGGQYDEAAIELYLLNIYRWYYRVYWATPPLREVFERFPQYMIWDDHEIMDGWGSLTNQERRARISGFFEERDSKTNQLLVDLMWRAACRAYFEYEHSHNPPTPVDLNRPDDCQWDYAFRQGDAAFYVLDMRGHHDVEKNKRKRTNLDPNLLLGQAQFDRFCAWLRSPEARTARCLFVVSPVPVLHWVDRLVNYMDLGEAKDDFMDEWGHETNWAERNQLLDTVFAEIGRTGRPLVLLSGDVHCASAFRLQHRKFPAARVYQVTSSAISRKPAPQISLLGISSGGTLDGHPDVSSERLYALTGNKNFSLVRARNLDDGSAEVVVDLHWPGGDEGEVTKRRLVLR